MRRNTTSKYRNEDTNVNVTGLLKNSACWRSGRKDNIYKLKELLEPSPLFERNICDLDLVYNNDSDPTSIEFEDIYGYYDALVKQNHQNIFISRNL